MMLPVLQIGPFVIQLPGLALLAGLWIAFDLIEKEARGLHLEREAIVRTTLYAIFAGLIGGRFLFAAQHLDLYLANPLGLLSLDAITLDPYGAVAVGVLIAVGRGRRLGLQLRPTLDAIVPGLAAMMIAVAVAHLLSGDAYGSPTSLPWAIQLWGEGRHPAQIYELLGALAVYFAWRRHPASPHASGAGFLYWFTLQIGALIFLEPFRADSTIWAGGFRAAQVLGLLALAAALGMAQAWKAAEPVERHQQIKY